MTHRYPPIGDYALLADCFSAALVSRDCAIDWACMRRFDRGSCCARLLDWDRGGYFGLTPRDLRSVSRRYLENTLVLETEVRTGGGRARVLDCFAVQEIGRPDPWHWLLRLVEGIEGETTFDLVMEPRFDYGALRPWLRQHAPGLCTAVGGDDALVFDCGVDLEVDRDACRLSGTVTVRAGQRVHCRIGSQWAHELQPTAYPPDEIDRRLAETVRWWRSWSKTTTARGPYADQIRRSAIVLKGLTCAPTGAIVAAPTTSLPERSGGSLNWDYRYSWVRDSTLALSALARVGHPTVARRFGDFILRSAAGHVDELQVMYGCYGEHRLEERELDLSGYRDSGPVRVGNAAANQLQLDTYGHILAAAELTHAPDDLDDDEWQFLERVVDAAAGRWQEPDQGMWEERGEPAHHTHSKVLLWVALDHGIRLAERFDRGTAKLDQWRDARDCIRHAVETHAVAEGGWFTQTFENDEVDGALLSLPLAGFVDPKDRRMLRTVDRIREQLSIGEDGFIRRYRHDDESVFLLCAFWLVEVLAQQDRRAEAVDLFERLLATANDVGQFAEEYDPRSRELLGNFPQAFSHLAMINAACALGVP